MRVGSGNNHVGNNYAYTGPHAPGCKCPTCNGKWSMYIQSPTPCACAYCQKGPSIISRLRNGVMWAAEWFGIPLAIGVGWFLAEVLM